MPTELEQVQQELRVHRQMLEKTIQTPAVHFTEACKVSFIALPNDMEPTRLDCSSFQLSFVHSEHAEPLNHMRYVFQHAQRLSEIQEDAQQETKTRKAAAAALPTQQLSSCLLTTSVSVTGCGPCADQNGVWPSSKTRNSRTRTPYTSCISMASSGSTTNGYPVTSCDLC